MSDRNVDVMSAHFEINAAPVGGRILVNGADVTDQVSAAHLDLSKAAPTVLTLLHIAGTGPIEGDGIVQVVEQLDGDPVDTICSFLAGIDPQQLEQDALMGHTAGRSLTAVMLDVLAGYARGNG